MYHELVCYDRTALDEEVRTDMFAAVKYEFNSIAVLPCYLQVAKESIVEGMDISAVIDFPYGVSDMPIRSHAIISAIRKGSTIIDLVVNNVYFINKKYDKFYDDIESASVICKENRVLLRAILEYRLFEYSDIVKMGNGLREVNIEYIIPSTNSQLDVWDDNLAISIELTEKAKTKVITNGNIWKKEQYQSIKKSGVFGVRLSGSAIENIK